MTSSCTFIDLSVNYPALVEKIVGYTGMAVWSVSEIDGEVGYAISLLIETDEGYEWREISDCEKVGATKKPATLSSIDGGKK